MRRVLGGAALVVVLLEVVVLVVVGHLIGGAATFLLVVALMLLGGWLVKREGARAWRDLSAAVAEHRSPDREILDGTLVLAGGALMLLPGFLTDLVGLALLVPPIRRALHRPVAAMASRVVPLPGRPRTVRARRGAGQPYVPAGATRPTAGSTAGRVIDGTVVDHDQPR